MYRLTRRRCSLRSFARAHIRCLIIKVLALVILAHCLLYLWYIFEVPYKHILHLHAHFVFTSNKHLLQLYQTVTNLRFEVPARSILCIPQKSPPHTIECVICVFEIGVDLVLVFVGFGLFQICSHFPFSLHSKDHALHRLLHLLPIFTTSSLPSSPPPRLLYSGVMFSMSLSCHLQLYSIGLLIGILHLLWGSPRGWWWAESSPSFHPHSCPCHWSPCGCCWVVVFVAIGLHSPWLGCICRHWAGLGFGFAVVGYICCLWPPPRCCRAPFTVVGLYSPSLMNLTHCGWIEWWLEADRNGKRQP